MYVTLRANLGEQHKVFLIPQQALLRDTVGAYVMTVGQDNKVRRKDVTTSDMRDGNWVVNQGLSAGDRVVVSGVQNVKAGEPAKPTLWHPASPTSAATVPGAAPGGH